MRYEQDGSGKRLQRRLESFAAFEVEMVGRLVQHEEVRAGRNDDCKREPSTLATREDGDGLLVLRPAGKEEAA